MWRPCVFGKYSRSILGAYGMYGKSSGNMRLVLGAFGMKFWRCWVPNSPNGPRTWRMLSERFQYPFRVLRKACGMSSVHSRSIRRVLKAFGKHTESVPKGNLSTSICGKYSVYTESILKPYWNIRKINGKHSVILWGKHNRRDIWPV